MVLYKEEGKKNAL